MLYVIKEGDGVKRGKEGRYERAVKTVRAISRRLDDDGVYVYASHASFFVVISAFPFIMLLLNLLRYIFPFGERELYSIACEYLPQKLS
jgi:membrane protein